MRPTLWMFAVLVAICSASCAPPAPNVAALAVVSPVPAPSLPAMVAAIAPSGTVASLAQIRIRFAHDLIPLAALETPSEKDALDHFTIEPALPGRFLFLMPKLVGFEADAALPIATRVRVHVSSGLRDITGRALTRDIAWTFQTHGVDIDVPEVDDGSADDSSDEGALVSAAPTPNPLLPRVKVASSVELDRASLLSHAKLIAPDQSVIALVIRTTPRPSASPTAAPTPEPAAAFDPSQRPYHYVLVPAQPLAKDTRYAIVMEPGILSAHGNLPTEKAARGEIMTYTALTYKGFEPHDAVTDERGFPRSIAFVVNNPLDRTSARAAITVDPAPRDTTHLLSFTEENGETIVGINQQLLAPRRAYTLHVAAALRDVYGQMLGRDITTSFTTSANIPDLWLPTGNFVFPSTLNLALDATSVNVPRGEAIFKRLTPEERLFASTSMDVNEPIPLLGSAWAPFALNTRDDVSQTKRIPLRDVLGGPSGAFAYGVRASVGSAENTDAATRPDYLGNAGIVQVTNLGAFAQWFPNSGFVRVHHLSDGAPVPGASVVVYVQDPPKNGTSPAPSRLCARGTTDADGVATLAGATFASCSALHDGRSAPSYAVIVREGAAWAYVQTDSYSGYFAIPGSSTWPGDAPISYGTIYSDRRLYQPGEKVALTGVGWFLSGDVLRRGRAPLYTVTIAAPKGNERDIGRVALNAYGTFSLPLTLPRDADVGYYTVKARAGNGEEIDGEFQVAEFRPPNFKVDLSLDKTIAYAGDVVSADANSAYLFGAPVEGGQSTFAVTRGATSFAPPGNDDYTFGLQWSWPDQQPNISSDVLQTQTVVDARGNSTQAVAITGDVPLPMTYSVDTQTTDVSNLTVDDTKTFTVLPARTLIGLKSDFIASAGAPIAVSGVLVDSAGKPVADAHVRLMLQRAVYAQATQVEEGAESADISVMYTTVATADASSSHGKFAAKLTPPKAGTYRIRAVLADATDERGATDMFVWAAGGGDISWAEEDPQKLTVRLDRERYRIGDRARALIQSPFADADLYAAVVRHDVRWKKIARVHGSAPTVTFTVTPDMLPNAAFEAILVRRGRIPTTHVPAGNAFSRVGLAPFNVALDGKRLTVSALPEFATRAPGDRQSIALHLTDAAGKPLVGQCTVVVANDAVLQLTGYRLPDLVSLVYETQPIAMRFGDSRADVVINALARPEQKGYGFGGGLSVGAADTRVRHAFSPLAYYAGSVITDARGNAKVTFTLPDDLTTWRVMVVAATADGRFGNDVRSFVATKALLANPAVPQFARPGDIFDAGVAVTNAAQVNGSMRVDGTVSYPLGFLVNGVARPGIALQTPAPATSSAYRFPVVARGIGEGRVTFRINAGGASDAFSIPLPVSERDVTESIITTGTTDARVSIPLLVDPATPGNTGGLQIVLASSVVPDVLVSAKTVFDDDFPVAENSTSRLAAAADLVRLADSGHIARVPDAAARAMQELQLLKTFARPDGGFVAYPGARSSDPFVSTLVLASLGRAQRAGIAVDAHLLAASRRYVGSVLADPGAWKWCRLPLCKALVRLRALDALAEAGDRRSEFLTQVLAQEANLGLADRIRLERVMFATPGFAARAQAALHTITDRLYETGATESINVADSYSWLGLRWSGGTVAAQAQALRLLIGHVPTEQLDKVTTSLLALRRNGSWGCGGENAEALNALSDLIVHENTASDFVATAAIGVRPLGSAHFTGLRAPQRTLTVASANLPRGKSSLALARAGHGTLHYAVTYTYRPAGTAPGRFNGLRVARDIHPANGTSVLATMGLTMPSSPASLPAGAVYDIGLQIITDHPVDHVAIEDPIPAGMEAVDTSFKTSTTAFVAQGDSWEIDYQQIHHDRIDAYADHLGPGVYVVHYLVRTVTPGTYAWPGAQAHLVEQPQEFGRTAATMLVVR